jgi:hypothetical protein
MPTLRSYQNQCAANNSKIERIRQEDKIQNQWLQSNHTLRYYKGHNMKE